MSTRKTVSPLTLESADSISAITTILFNAARDGKLRQVEIYLQQYSPEEARWLLSQVVENSTPLIIACRNGHIDIVNYLIRTYEVDIEQVGSVTFDRETIEGAPPLWCAAAAGHYSTVEALVKSGALVNHTTYSNSTPLRAACFDGHFEIVKYLVENGADIELANRHGHTCLMISCYKNHYRIAEYLLKLGADINRKSIRGNTALHDCAESGSLEIMQLLLESNAKMDIDAYGMTPLKAAAVAGHIKIVDFLVDQRELSISKNERIDSLELLGATFVDKKRDMQGALTYWNRAVDLRNSDQFDIIVKERKKPILAYDYTEEFRSVRDIENLIGDPDEMRMQALLIRERILGPAHPDTTYYIRYRGAVYADSGNFKRCMTLWMHALDLQQTSLEPLNPMTQSSLLSFAELFAYMLVEREGDDAYPQLSFLEIFTIFKSSVAELRRFMDRMQVGPLTEKDMTSYNRVITIALHLMSLVAKLKDVHNTDLADFKQEIYSLVKMNLKGKNGCSLLHLALSSTTSVIGKYPVCNFPDCNVVHFLLECGCDPNEIDMFGNTSLHTIMGASLESTSFSEIQHMVDTLLKHDAHLDVLNFENKMCVDVGHQVVLQPLRYTSLKCLCSRVIMAHHIQYQGIIPKELEKFVSVH